MKAVTYSAASVRALRRLPRNVRTRIVAKVGDYAADPASLANNVTALRGEPGAIRLRVGDWRVVMIETGTEIQVVRIGPRGSIYE